MLVKGILPPHTHNGCSTISIGKIRLMQSAKQLSRRLAYLHQKRKAGKQQHARTGRLTPAQRLAVLQKNQQALSCMWRQAYGR